MTIELSEYVIDAIADAVVRKMGKPCDDAISRQAVIRTIYDNKSDFKNDFAQGFFADEIRDLSPVTPQNCDDAVSRLAVLALVSDYDLNMGQVVKGIHALPPVSPQPKMGRWIRGFGNTSCICSECHGNGESCYRFCQHCGRKMQEVEGN